MQCEYVNSNPILRLIFHRDASFYTLTRALLFDLNRFLFLSAVRGDPVLCQKEKNARGG